MNKLRQCLLILSILGLSACSSHRINQNNPVDNQPPPMKPNDAQKLAKDTSAYNPTASGYNVQLGVAYLRQGNMQRAKSKLLLALKQDPKSVMANDAMGYYMERIGESKQAAYYYQKAIRLKPDSGDAQNNYGAFLCRQKHYKEAENYFLRAVQDPNYTTPDSAYENAGLCALEIPDEGKAEAYFIKALKNNYDLPTSSLALAELYYKQGRYQKSYALLANYARLAKPSPESLYYEIKVAHKLNKNDKAASDFLFLQKHFPKSKEYQALQAGRDL